jgi:hypothetical protein
MVGVCVVLEEYMEVRQYHLMQQCAIGFSGSDSPWTSHEHNMLTQVFYSR